MLDMDTVLEQNPHFFKTEVGDELLLYRPNTQQAVRLDALAAVIYQMCDGTRSGNAIVAELGAQYPDNLEEVAQDIRTALNTMFGPGVLVTQT
ncbi:MAG: PqqD family peptide modification chaperone [Pseudomonadota bacterium]